MNLEYFFDSIGLVMIVFWLLLFVQSHRMFYLFKKKYPEVVKRKIPNAFDSYADPEKILFFFRKENLSLLKNDKEIWHLRRQTKVLFLLSIGAPVLIFLLLILIFLTQ